MPIETFVRKFIGHWKNIQCATKGRISPIHKRGSKGKVSQFRHVTLTSHVIKILKRKMSFWKQKGHLMKGSMVSERVAPAS